MNVKPLGPEGIKSRIAEIEARIQSLEGSTFAEAMSEQVAAIHLPVTGVGAGINDMSPMSRSSTGGGLAPMNPTNLVPANGSYTTDHLKQLADTVADQQSLDRNLFRALIKWESSWNPNSTSSVGAKGLTQLMPETARELGVSDPYDPAQNLRAGAKYLKAQLDRFNSVELALAAYNAGPGAVKRYGGVPPFAETQTYVKRIMGELNR
ncbi:MAG: lytic transglycosylase domain-containing protein [Fimbriimonadales bacterium]